MGDFNTITNGHVIETEVSKRNNETNRVYESTDLRDIYRIFHPNAKEYTFFSAPQGSFSKANLIVSNKESLNRYKKIEIMPCILSYNHGLKLLFDNNNTPAYIFNSLLSISS